MIPYPCTIIYIWFLTTFIYVQSWPRHAPSPCTIINTKLIINKLIHDPRSWSQRKNNTQSHSPYVQSVQYNYHQLSKNKWTSSEKKLPWGGEEATDITSNNPHLTGEEKTKNLQKKEKKTLKVLLSKLLRRDRLIKAPGVAHAQRHDGSVNFAVEAQEGHQVSRTLTSERHL